MREMRTVRAAPAGPVVCCYLVGEHMDAVLAAVLPAAEIRADSTAPIPPPAMPAGRDVALVGYSKGCQSVRAHLWRGDTPIAVVTIDGTHASWPPAPWQIDVWRELAAEARAGRVLWVATCTSQNYTERLPGGRAFAATRTVLERAVGQELPPGAEVHDGALHVYSVASRDVDPDAHVAQQRVWLPRILREHVAPWLAARAPAPPWRDRALRIGERAVLWSLAQLGTREEPPGSNTGPAIREWLRPCHRGGRPLGLTAGPWCAAHACAAAAAAAHDEELDLVPHLYRASGLELCQDAQARGAWVDVAELRGGQALRRGDLVILQRSGGWTRHVARVETAPDVGGRYRTCDGNHEDRVALVDRTLGDADLLGAIRYP